MKISIIIPIYNTQKLLSRSIESVLCQEYTNFELILIDDGSTDNSPAICEKYAQNDKRIIFHQIPHKGVSFARNYGLSVATGKYVAFLDADDEFYPNYLKTMVKTIIHYKSDIVICRHKRIYHNDNIIISQRDMPAAQSGNFNPYHFFKRFKESSYQLYTGWEYCWDKLINLELIKKFNIIFPENFIFCEDRIFNLQCFCNARLISAINNILYKYYLPKKNYRSLSFNISDERYITQHQFAYIKLIEILKNFGLYDDELREAILSDYLNTMIVAIYRYCSPICNLSKKLRKKIIKIIINHKMTNEALTLYTPKTSLESRVMPLLLRQKDVDMIIEFATLKAKSIYQ